MLNFNEVKMKGKPFSGNIKNGNNPGIDLTRSIENTLKINSSEEYINPAKTWCSYMEREFRASRIMAGAESGTRIDATASMADGAGFADRMQPVEFTGRYYYIDTAAWSPDKDPFTGYNNELFLFLKGGLFITELPEELFIHLLELPAKIWIAAGEFIIKGKPGFYFKQRLSEEGKFIIEDIDMNAAGSVAGNGDASAQPLRLIDTTCASCRLIVFPDK